MKRNKVLLILSVLTVLLCITGCNALESVDRSIDKRDSEALIEDGSYRLAEGAYAEALDLFTRASETETSDVVYRGMASSYAGLAGFNMFSVINILQNSTEDAANASVFFTASNSIKDKECLDKAIDSMAKVSAPGSDDLLLRALLAVISAADDIYVKYDSFSDRKLNNSDRIGTYEPSKGDGSHPITWSDLYSKFSAPAGSRSLEQAYIDLANALGGRGTEKMIMSPFGSVTKKALFTESNFRIIIAVEDFANRLKAADRFYLGSNDAEFKRLIMSLDDGAI